MFVLIHKIGDTLANLTLRLLFQDLGFTNDEIAFYDVGIGFIALLAGRVRRRRDVRDDRHEAVGARQPGADGRLELQLRGAGRRTATATSAWPAAIGFENFASGIGGVAVVAYLSALCNLRFTATQYALLSALASIAGRFLTGTTAGSLIEAMGYVNFYLLTTLIAMPGVFLFWYMVRSGLADVSIGTAGTGRGVTPLPLREEERQRRGIREHATRVVSARGHLLDLVLRAETLVHVPRIGKPAGHPRRSLGHGRAGIVEAE